MRLSITILLLSVSLGAVMGSPPPGVLDGTESLEGFPFPEYSEEKRELKSKCMGIKTPKSTKSPKSSSVRRLSKSSKSSKDCSCPCCDVATCQFYRDADPSGEYDGFCQVAPFYYKCPDDGTDPCKYDSEGEFDEDGNECFAECCFYQLGFYYGCGGRDRRLNSNSASNKRVVEEQDDGIIVEVTAEHPSSLDWIKEHLDEMRERMEKGDAVRDWDPLFEAYFENAEDIDMACVHAGGDVISCTYSGASECAIDLIKAHAGYHEKIAESIRELGTHEIDDMHAVPTSCRDP